MKFVYLCAATIVGTVCLTGCGSVLSETCQKALPVLSESNSLATDASIALENASDAIDKSSALTTEQKKEVRVQINNARLALQASSAALVLVHKACEAPNVSTVFRDFLTAWAAIRPFLALIGTTGGPSSIQDPIVWRMHVASGER